MTKMRAIAFLAAVLTLLAVSAFCGTGVKKANAQTRTREETHELVVGAVDSEHEAVTVFTMINRTSARKSLDYLYKDSEGGFTLKVTTTFSNGLVTHGLQGGTSLSGKSSSTRTLSSKEDVRCGRIETKGTESWSPKYQMYFPDVGVDVTIQIREIGSGKVVYTLQDSPQLTGGESFLLQALITPKTETGLAVVNPNGSAATLTLRLFDNSASPSKDGNGVRLPVATATVEVAAGEMLPIFLSKTFSSLPIDWMGNKLTDGNVEVEATGFVGVVGFRLDGNYISWLTVFQGRE